ncbi:hypothetical protein TWF569_009545 [Orbilia oligospora]|uniref:Secreted protein n=1 Tax=Orbilia oligospora TaxID=2813651 RepID=A0A7C8JBY6_ORBOL|nr:hypothetical protein TWF706_006594 [Orbilia oligospora]KAF3104850.1 hypothetical protein TWF103_006820 [Orbilia oligospora]KAF3109281.1 hypothetical protein TWF102_010053 [Orbilia oligospora]KAF3135128.1 hypothetical protein TWF594_008516 [Orbilia oligospora]KAF3136237.1 hypothetical protein TWF569_009545 [Orbilia oligospora]
MVGGFPRQLASHGSSLLCPLLTAFLSLESDFVAGCDFVAVAKDVSFPPSEASNDISARPPVQCKESNDYLHRYSVCRYMCTYMQLRRAFHGRQASEDRRVNLSARVKQRPIHLIR